MSDTVMSQKGVAPVTAAAAATATTVIAAWALETFTGTKIPAEVQVATTSLLSVGFWHLMPSSWEA